MFDLVYDYCPVCNHEKAHFQAIHQDLVLLL